MGFSHYRVCTLRHKYIDRMKFDTELLYFFGNDTPVPVILGTSTIGTHTWLSWHYWYTHVVVMGISENKQTN